MRVVRAAKYLSAGTVEFLVQPDGTYYFLEVNTRLQVEHTVTEVVTGIDIVREQLLIAMGEPISFSQAQVAEHGYAMELRINAEDPQNDFFADSWGNPGLPVVRRARRPARPALLSGVQDHALLRFPHRQTHGVRLHLAGGGGPDDRALNGFLIIGVKTTIPYFQQIVKEPDFSKMKLDTAYIDDHPQLMDYREQEREVEKLARLIAEINAHEKNPYTQ